MWPVQAGHVPCTGSQGHCSVSTLHPPSASSHCILPLHPPAASSQGTTHPPQSACCIPQLLSWSRDRSWQDSHGGTGSHAGGDGSPRYLRGFSCHLGKPGRAELFFFNGLEGYSTESVQGGVTHQGDVVVQREGGPRWDCGVLHWGSGVPENLWSGGLGGRLESLEQGAWMQWLELRN